MPANATIKKVEIRGWMVTRLTMGIISQSMQTLNHYVMHLKLTENHMSVTL